MLDVILGGGPQFSEIGTEGSTGTKLFCLSGHVERPGVYEVTFGTTLGELLELAGGVAGGRAAADDPARAAPPAASCGPTSSICG